MDRRKILFLFFAFICHVTLVHTKLDTPESNPRVLKPPDKTSLQASEPYDLEAQESSSFMSRIANYFSPFESNDKNTIADSEAAATGSHGGGYQYLPPSQNHFEDGKKECNPCNQQPWIPIATNNGHETVVNFAPPSSHSSHFNSYDNPSELLQAPTNHVYGPPNQGYGPPTPVYGPPAPKFKPKPPSHQYGLPDDIRPPQLSSRPHLPHQSHRSQFNGKYGPPKRPSSSYGPPSSNYGPPPSFHRTRQPSLTKLSSYVKPPKFNGHSNSHGPPTGSYGVPMDGGYVAEVPIKPPVDYGVPPAPQGGYGVPPPPQSSYGAPSPPQNSYGAPSPPQNTYGAPSPPQNSYGAPSAPQNSYGLPLSPQSNYGVPSGPQTNYVPPAPPQNTYGAPEAPQNGYGAPEAPQLNYGVPSAPQSGYGAPIPSTQLYPVDTKEQYTPTVPSDLPNAVPSDSYGAPVTGSNINYFPSRQEIPLPNLSSKPVLPIHNSGDFRSDYSKSQKAQDNVQILPSVNVAEFVSSVEYPIDVIQSPLIELSIKEQDNKHAPSYNNVNQVPTEDPYIPKDFKLSENPIIVDDTHVASSNVNTTVFDGKNKKDVKNDLGVVGEKTETKSFKDGHQKNFLQGLLLQQGLFSNQQVNNGHSPGQFMVENKTFSPVMDYGNWEPSFGGISTSMVPPPLGHTTWLSPINDSTTTKPKQIQIIVPYVMNKKEKPAKWRHEVSGTSGYNTGAYTTLVPVYMPPPSGDASIWSQFLDDFRLAELNKLKTAPFTPPPTEVKNIADILAGSKANYHGAGSVPYDVLSLQNNIHEWTQQEYSNRNHFNREVQQIPDKFQGSKKIPDEYFTTQHPVFDTTTTPSIHGNIVLDTAASSKNQQTVKPSNDIETNLIPKETTTNLPTSTSTATTIKPNPDKSNKEKKSLWDGAQVTISPVTKEKVYVVTPQTHSHDTFTTPATAWSSAPKIFHGKVNNDAAFSAKKFAIRVEPESDSSRSKLKKAGRSALKVVYSEWPHLINNLGTTTTEKSTSRHPLFGLMDYTPDLSSDVVREVETYLGHSMVTKSQITSTTTKPLSASDSKKSFNAHR